jgi:hypothetical protein
MKSNRWVNTALLTFLVLAPIGVNSQSQVEKLTPTDAKDHMGERAAVCGEESSTRYAATTRGNPRPNESSLRMYLS